MAYIQYPNPTPIFPTLPPLAYSVHKKPIMASRATTGVSGRETKLACCVYPRWAFTLTYGGNSWLRDQTQNITPGPNPRVSGFTELQQLAGLFLQCAGSYGEFYYQDVDDNSRSGVDVGISNGVLTDYPVFYTWGTGPFSSPLFAPVGGLISLDAVYGNGVVIDPSHYAIDASNTGIQFSNVPGGGTVISADFHFYFRCRFLDDTMEYSQFSENLWEVKEVRFESVKP